MDVKNTSTSSGMDQNLKIQTTASQDVDQAGAEKITEWVNKTWTKNNGYYKSHVAVKSVINKFSLWVMGEGIEADTKTKEILDSIIGWGKETAAQVFDNQIRVEHIDGDSYAEIITTDGKLINETGSNLLNLKPLNPGRMKHLVNEQDILMGYAYTNPSGKDTPFDVEEIFHLCLNRNANEIHGTGDVETITTFLDKIKQLDEDMSVMFHRYIMPLLVWSLNTDDTTAIATFKTQEKAAWNKGDNLIKPDGAVEFELIEAGKNGVDPMVWRNKWTEEVIKGGGVPALIMAIEAGTTEASSKMVAWAWEKIVKQGQREFESQVKLQLHLEVNLPQSITIQKSLTNDNEKDGQIDKDVNTDPAKHE